MNGYGTMESVFGVNPDALALQSLAHPDTPAAPAIATTEVTTQPANSAIRRILDPQGSASFWIFLAAILGLAIVSGELKVAAALGGRLGRRK